MFGPCFWQYSLAEGCPSPILASHAGFDGIEVAGSAQNFKPHAPAGGTISHFESKQTGNETLIFLFQEKSHNV